MPRGEGRRPRGRVHGVDKERKGRRQRQARVVVVATGATEHKPQSYGYGQSDKVLTQLEISERLARGELALPEKATIVMIQWRGAEERREAYCSRVCCTSAVKNALHLCERFPQARILVLFRDMRTYGFREAAYREAREKGVLFVRYEPERAPQLEFNGGRQDPSGSRGGETLRVRFESLRCDAKCRSMPTWWCWPLPWCRKPTARNCLNCCACR